MPATAELGVLGDTRAPRATIAATPWAPRRPCREDHRGACRPSDAAIEHSRRPPTACPGRPDRAGPAHLQTRLNGQVVLVGAIQTPGAHGRIDGQPPRRRDRRVQPAHETLREADGHLLDDEHRNVGLAGQRTRTRSADGPPVDAATPIARTPRAAAMRSGLPAGSRNVGHAPRRGRRADVQAAAAERMQRPKAIAVAPQTSPRVTFSLGQDVDRARGRPPRSAARSVAASTDGTTTGAPSNTRA